jgi:hypothetical protein
MNPQMGLPETSVWKYKSKEDSSWKKEIDYFVDCIKMKQKPEGDISDAKCALDIVSNIYEENGDFI